MRALKYTVIFLLLIPGSVVAQDIKTDILKIKEKYELNEFTSTIKYSFYNGTTLTEEANATYVYSKGNYYYKIKDFEIVKNDKCQLMVNHTFKSISVLPPDNENMYAELSKVPVDTGLKNIKNHSFRKINENEAIYTFEYKSGKYQKGEFYYNPKTYQVIKVKLTISKQYGEEDPDFKDGIFIIEYKSFSESVSAENKKLLSETNFVQINKNQVKLVKAYANYELNDYLTVKPE